MSKYKVGDAVNKVRGYKFPGIVVAVFKTIRGEERLVVECMVPQVEGMLHIFSPENLEADEWAEENLVNYNEAKQKLA